MSTTAPAPASSPAPVPPANGGASAPTPVDGANRRNTRMLRYFIFAGVGCMLLVGSLFYAMLTKRPQMNARANQVKQTAKRVTDQIPLLDKQRSIENNGFVTARSARQAPSAPTPVPVATPPPTETLISQAAPIIPAAMTATVRRVSNHVERRSSAAPKRGVVPGFQVIPCRLVGALESGSPGSSYAGSNANRSTSGGDQGSQTTSIKALVDEDVRTWDTHEIIIPRNTQCNAIGHFRQGRDRVFVEADFTFILPGKGASRTPLELVLKGIAKDRQYDAQFDTWGVTDMSDGIRGDFITTRNWDEVFLFASKFISGASSALSATSPGSFGQTYNNNTTSAATGLSGFAINPAVGGIQSVLEQEAARILARIEADGYFLRVPAGKQFYVLVPDGYSVADALPSGEAQALRQKHEDDQFRVRDERTARARAAEGGSFSGFGDSPANAVYRPTFTDPNLAALLRRNGTLDSGGILRRPATANLSGTPTIPTATPPDSVDSEALPAP